MVRIIADSTCDLSQNLIDKYNITIIPLHIVLGDREYRDLTEIQPDEIYAWSDANKVTPKTSAASVEDTIDVMKPILDGGDDIVAFCISEQMSTTGNVFRMVAQELEASDRVCVIDSRSLSTGIGLLVIKAAIMAGEGKSAEYIRSKITAMRDKVRASFVVDTLVYLHRGGRCSSVAAMAGSVLKLHPRIEVKDGKMDAGKKYRGSMRSVILNYAKDMEEDLRHAEKDRVFITHSGCDEEIVRMVYSYLQSLNYFDEILTTRAGGVISSHCGYGTLGILYLAAE